MSAPASPTTTAAEKFPAGLPNAFAFAVFNALSFQIVLSSPMLLYARTLGATSTVLGLITGMMPFLVILQIPAAGQIGRFGYRRFVLGGWTSRVLCIGGLALVPLTTSLLDATSRLALVLLLLFAFNVSRGISSAGWLPWITQLVPATVRGRYLATDAAWVNLASFVTFVLAAFCLGREPAAWQFTLTFAFSAAMGAVSLTFLKRIPDVSVPGKESASDTRVPWREIANFPPFRRLLWFNVGWALAFGGMNTFVLAYLKIATHFPERDILLANATYFLGGLASLWVLGLRLDRFGSKPVIGFALGGWLFIVLGWAALAGRVAEPRYALVIALQMAMGLCGALTGMANTRLAMQVAPAQGRSHFFALFSVVGSLTMGLAPVIWGVFIDVLGGWRAEWRGFEFNQFSLFFGAVAVAFVATLALSRRLVEPSAASLEELLKEVLLAPPQRMWLRLWSRE
ncbi:MAG: MFS transporter [Verrucomicrobia bacterium]|nr:MFS transporter [Verrucomicrobiota bacterium]